MTADASVYLLQRRLGPKGKRTKKEKWETVAAYADRAAAERACKARERVRPNQYRVYGVPLVTANESGEPALRAPADAR